MGESRDDDALSDAALWGFDGIDAGPDLEPGREEGLWAGHQRAMLAFLAVCTQWRVVAGQAGLIYVGLDYAAADVGLRRAGIETTPDLWSELQGIETGAVAALNEDRS